MFFQADTVTVGNPFRGYDVLAPVINSNEGGVVEEKKHVEPEDGVALAGSALAAPLPAAAMTPSSARSGESQQSLESYANHLLEMLDKVQQNGSVIRTAPDSPSKSFAPLEQMGTSANGAATETSEALTSDKVPRTKGELLAPGLAVEGKAPPLGLRGRKGSFLKSDEALVEEVQEPGGSREAVEILSRNTTKSAHRFLSSCGFKPSELTVPQLAMI